MFRIALGERVEERLTDEPHEAGQANEIDAVLLQRLDDRAVVSRTIGGQPGIQVHGLDTCLAGPQETRRIRAIRDDHRNPGVELTSPNRLNDRLKIAPPPGDQDAESAVGSHCLSGRPRPVRRQDSTRSPEVTEPMRKAAGSPCSRRDDSTRSASDAAQTTIRPTPMLNARSISSRSMAPRCANQPEQRRHGPRARSIAAAHPSGSVLGRFSVMPPPVMWAIPLTRFAPSSGRTAARYER